MTQLTTFHQLFALTLCCRYCPATTAELHRLYIDRRGAYLALGTWDSLLRYLMDKGLLVNRAMTREEAAARPHANARTRVWATAEDPRTMLRQAVRQVFDSLLLDEPEHFALVLEELDERTLSFEEPAEVAR
jgi:hypothetical protein